MTSTTTEDCAEFNDITCDQNVLGTLYLTNNPLLQVVNTENNYLQVLIADNCPMLGSVKAFNNQLMWLDLKDVKKQESIEESMLQIDNQTPSKVAYKLSPTEVGLLVHERFDVERVLNLKANGKSVTPAWSTIDGKQYFVFSNDGASAESLVGQKTTYEYETKWPYAWQDGNSKGNNLPVTLNVTKVEKLPSWIKLSSSDALTGEVGGTLMPPTVTLRQVRRQTDVDIEQ